MTARNVSFVGLVVLAGLSVGALVALALFHTARWGYLP